MLDDNTPDITGRIEKWWRTPSVNGEFVIWGYIYDDFHQRWLDGTRFHTSGIKERNVREGDIVITRNSQYFLGKKLEINSN